MTFPQWSQTPASNATGVTSVNWAEGQTAGSVNNSARQVMADVAVYRDVLKGGVTSGGTADAQTITTGMSCASYAVMPLIAFEAGAALTNTTTTTIAVDGLTAKTVKRPDGTDLTAGDIRAGGIFLLAYEAGADVLILLNPTPTPTAAGVFTTIELGATDTTLARSGAGDISVEGNAVYRAGGTDVPVTDGGTGASTVAGARTALALDYQVFTSSGTWTKPSTGTIALIMIWGGGGSGGRAGATDGGGGGGGGAYRQDWLRLSALGATETVTVGAGGAARTIDETDGATGSNTSFGSWRAVTGGGGGEGATAANGGGGGGGGWNTAGSVGNTDGTGGAGGTGYANVTSAEEIAVGYDAAMTAGGAGGSSGDATGFNSLYGGGGGGAGIAAGAGKIGGVSSYGGGGGGGGSGDTSGGAGGASQGGGNGGAGATAAAAATAGTQPGGGGGGSESGNSGAGGDGMCIVFVF